MPDRRPALGLQLVLCSALTACGLLSGATAACASESMEVATSEGLLDSVLTLGTFAIVQPEGAQPLASAPDDSQWGTLDIKRVEWQYPSHFHEWRPITGTRVTMLNRDENWDAISQPDTPILVGLGPIARPGGYSTTFILELGSCPRLLPAGQLDGMSTQLRDFIRWRGQPFNATTAKTLAIEWNREVNLDRDEHGVNYSGPITRSFGEFLQKDAPPPWEELPPRERSTEDHDAMLPPGTRSVEIWIHIPDSWRAFQGLICPFTEALGYGVCFTMDVIDSPYHLTSSMTAGTDIVLEALPDPSYGDDHITIARITAKDFLPTRRVLVELDPHRAPSTYDDLRNEEDSGSIGTVGSITSAESFELLEAQPTTPPCEDPDC
jgi:hypothetical protein